MQSRFAHGPQLRVRVISVISELYFVANGSVLSRMMSSTVQYLVYLFSLVYSCHFSVAYSCQFSFLLVLCLFNLFSLDHGSAKKQVRTLHAQLKIIEEVEKNPGEKRVDISK
jgi:hypothetical protein